MTFFPKICKDKATMDIGSNAFYAMQSIMFYEKSFTYWWVPAGVWYACEPL